MENQQGDSGTHSEDVNAPPPQYAVDVEMGQYPAQQLVQPPPQGILGILKQWFDYFEILST